MRRVAHSSRIRNALAFALRPRVSLGIWAVVIGAWHIPAVYDYALTHQTTHDLEHFSFIAVGLLAWTQIVDPARRNTLTPSQRLGCAFAMVAFSVGLGGVLLAAGPLYPAYASQATRLFTLSPAADQHLAALVMMAEQLGAFALCAACLLPDLGRARIERRRLLSADRPADALR
jgi:cytochrome c oxidase assembly factor CtaG